MTIASRRPAESSSRTSAAGGI